MTPSSQWNSDRDMSLGDDSVWLEAEQGDVSFSKKDNGHVGGSEENEVGMQSPPNPVRFTMPDTRGAYTPRPYSHGKQGPMARFNRYFSGGESEPPPTTQSGASSLPTNFPSSFPSLPDLSASNNAFSSFTNYFSSQQKQSPRQPPYHATTPKERGEKSWWKSATHNFPTPEITLKRPQTLFKFNTSPYNKDAETRWARRRSSERSVEGMTPMSGSQKLPKTPSSSGSPMMSREPSAYTTARERQAKLDFRINFKDQSNFTGKPLFIFSSNCYFGNSIISVQ